MKRAQMVVPALLIALAVTAGGWAWWRPGAVAESLPAPVDVAAFLAQGNEGFARDDGPWRFEFPADHGAHPDRRMETWNFTGRLQTATGRRFGFQLNFFRLALQPQPPPSPSAWAVNQVYRAHFALSDEQQERVQASERFSRAALGLSGADRDPVRVWLEDWSMTVSADGGQTGFRLRAGEEGTQMILDLESVKPPVLEGGLGPADGPANPFHAYLLTRLHARGTLTVGGEHFDVTGQVWLDRAWGLVPLTQGQVQWRRFTLQLEDGRDLLLLQLRRRDGSGIPIVSGLIVAADGSGQRLERRDLTLETLDEWTSPRTGRRYPARWRLRIPGERIELQIEPWLADQELDLSMRYWSGAVRVSGSADGKAVSGGGFVEIPG